ncbi:MAG: hypothetical protein LBR73_03920 [Oscillospiraceae bacterium]|nr:hypothetical protein [Oscillospiraceae bacterium]
MGLDTRYQESLRQEFRHVMRIPVGAAHEGDLRDALHSLLDKLLNHPLSKRDTFLQTMTRAALLRLRALEFALLRRKEEYRATDSTYEIWELCEDLAAAADVLLAPLGRKVTFTHPVDEGFLRTDKKVFRLMFLEAVCNAALHTQGEEINIRLRLFSETATLRFASAGTLDFEKLHGALQSGDGGAAAILRQTRLLGGSVLWTQDGAEAVCALRLPVESTGKATISWLGAEDFTAMLLDRLSPVYVALSPVAL